MRTRSTNNGSPTAKRLVCFTCGNTHRFIEVMAEEAHIVDGDLNYIRLLEAFVGHYVCCECGETLQAELLQNRKPGRLQNYQR
ncbi:MAG: hypothetical protein MUF81_06215 [Verrucomicrobia bacterium]|jgi:hypothetical protein|nr:hypothetical protein [Verrucomicrobiota bacterium]